MHLSYRSNVICSNDREKKIKRDMLDESLEERCRNACKFDYLEARKRNEENSINSFLQKTRHSLTVTELFSLISG